MNSQLSIFQGRFLIEVILSRLVLGAVVVIAGCSQGQSEQVNVLHKTIRMPYFEYCADIVASMKEVVDYFEGEYNFKTLLPNKTLMSGYSYGGVLELSVTVDKDYKQNIEIITNRYLMACGPNSVVEIDAGNLSESVIRNLISRDTNVSDEYGGPFVVEVRDNTTFVYFNRPLTR